MLILFFQWDSLVNPSRSGASIHLPDIQGCGSVFRNLAHICLFLRQFFFLYNSSVYPGTPPVDQAGLELTQFKLASIS